MQGAVYPLRYRRSGFSNDSISFRSRIDATRPRNTAGSWRSDPDVELMERVRDGEMEAFDVLFAKYSGPLVTFASRFLGSRDRAEEVSQTAFLQLFRSRRRYQARARFATFLYRIAINLCLNELRAFDYTRKLESLDMLDGTDSTAPPFLHRVPDHDTPEPADHLAAREIATELNKALRRLPPNQRTALLLSRIEGSSYHDVADTLGMSVSAVKSLIFRATSELRRQLAEILN